MTPYADFLYFGIALYWVIPAIVLGLMGRLTWHWVLVSTLAMGILQMALPAFVTGERWWVPVAAATGWTVWQWTVATTYLRVRLRQGAAAWSVWTAVTAALLPLLALKFVPASPLGSAMHLIGLSYVSFRAVDVVLGVYDGLITELQLRSYLTYVLFFPTLSAGPIDRYRRFVKDLAQRRTRAEYMQLLDEAVHAFFMGVLYKFVLAVIVRRWWLDPLTSAHGWRATFSYMYAYSAYLFFDFAGYSAFAVSFSKLFAIRSPENFNQPWRARDLAEFWSRWHISLSTFLRDQVYMRFLMAARKRGWFAGKHSASAVALLVSFGVMGVWHGAELHYVVYGLFHGVLLIALEAWRRRHPGRRGGAGAPYTWRDIPSTALTLQLVCVSFLIFSGRLF